MHYELWQHLLLNACRREHQKTTVCFLFHLFKVFEDLDLKWCDKQVLMHENTSHHHTQSDMCFLFLN